MINIDKDYAVYRVDDWIRLYHFNCAEGYIGTFCTRLKRFTYSIETNNAKCPSCRVQCPLDILNKFRFVSQSLA